MAVKIYFRLSSGTDADYALHSTNADNASPVRITGLLGSTDYSIKLDLLDGSGTVIDSEVATVTTNTSGTAAIPTIASFTPTSGYEGDLFTITGTGFTGVTEVTINGIEAPFAIVSDTETEVTVPAAGSGKVRVTNPLGTAVSATDFTINVATPTFPSPYNSMFFKLYGDSLVAAEGAGSTGNMVTWLTPLMQIPGKTVTLGVTGNNGMPMSPTWEWLGVTYKGMLNPEYMTNYVYNPYYQNPGDMKYLAYGEWVNELSWIIDEPWTVEQKGRWLVNGAKQVFEKARNKNNSNPDFKKPDGSAADPGDGYDAVFVIPPIDCARPGYRPVFDWVRNELASNPITYGDVVVKIDDIACLMPNAAGAEGYTGANDDYRDGTHQQDWTERFLAATLQRAVFNYQGTPIYDDLANLTASLSSGTVTATVDSDTAVEFRIKEGSGSYGAWQSHGIFNGITNPDYTVQARMAVKPATSLSYTAGGGSVTYETETETHIAAVTAAGGTVPDPDFLNDFILHAKANGYLSSIAWAGGIPTGYKEVYNQSRMYGINSFYLTSASETRKPDLIANSLGRDVYYFEGQDTFTANDEMHGSLDTNAVTLVGGVKDLTMIAVGKIANRTTTNGQSLMNLAGYTNGFDIGTTAAGAYMATRAGNVTNPAVTATTANTGANVLLGATLNATTKVLDVWVNGTKENTITISESLYSIDSANHILCAGAASHGMPVQGNFEFGVLLGSRPSDTVVASIQNFILTNLPNS